MENIKTINPNRKHDLTIEEVKSYPCFVHFSDDQILELIYTLKELSVIAYYLYLMEEGKH